MRRACVTFALLSMHDVGMMFLSGNDGGVAIVFGNMLFTQSLSNETVGYNIGPLCYSHLSQHGHCMICIHIRIACESLTVSSVPFSVVMSSKLRSSAYTTSA